MMKMLLTKNKSLLTILLTIYILFGGFFGEIGLYGQSTAYLRPNEILSAPNWISASYTQIDETTPNDATDYAYVTICCFTTIQVGLTDIPTGYVVDETQSYTVRIRSYMIGSKGPEDVQIALYDNGEGAYDNEASTFPTSTQAQTRDAWTTYTYTGSDYTWVNGWDDVAVHILSDHNSGDDTFQLTWVEVEVPITTASTWKPKIIIND